MILIEKGQMPQSSIQNRKIRTRPRRFPGITALLQRRKPELKARTTIQADRAHIIETLPWSEGCQHREKSEFHTV
eukprot:5395404-Amphidinium_carterae.1